MGKRSLDSSTPGTSDERRERKRLKKEEKQKRKDEKAQKKERKQSTSTHLQKETNDDVNNDVLKVSSLQRSENQDGFWRKSIELTVSLLPSALRNIQGSIEESLRSYLLKYSDEIGGIMLAFEKVKVRSDNKSVGSTIGKIFNELPHIHYDVSADVLVFNPEPGTKLTGSVSDCSFPSHLSLLVHQYFNASVPAEQLRASGFEFDDVQLQWYWQDSANTLTNSDCVDFVCNKLYESGGIVSIEGLNPMIQSKEI